MMLINPALRAWHDRSREPGLSVLLALELLVLFVVMPLDEMGWLTSWITDTSTVLIILAAAVVVSRRPAAVAAIILSAAAAGLTSWLHHRSPGPLHATLHLLSLLTYVVVLMSVVGFAVFAPGRVTFHRLQGAVLLYLKMAVAFAYIYRILATLAPGAFDPPGAIDEGGRAIYFSLVTLTSTGYGDLVPVHPLARSAATLEALIGQLFPATLLARLVTLELAARDRGAR
jgi:hypothetical protein